MKKIPHIVLSALALICMMTLVAVPHHHHAVGACFVQEICHQDGRVNDCHTHHSEKADTHHVIPVTGRHFSSVSQSASDGPWTLFLPGFSGVNAGDLRTPWFYIRQIFPDVQPGRYGQLFSSSLGLRAPPSAVL